jgi:hypothetical protein
MEAKLGGKPVRFEVVGDYPWQGHVTIRPQLDSSLEAGLHLRVPGWCEGAKLKVNGKDVADPTLEKGYFVVNRTWNRGDSVEMDLPMPATRIEAHPMVKEDIGRMAVRRGPLIYCAEAVDQTSPIDEMVLPREAKLKPVWNGTLFGGVQELIGTAEQVPVVDWEKKLYQSAPETRSVPIKLIPYCDWDNRKAGSMAVWLPSVPPAAPVGGPEVHAKVGISYLSGNAHLSGINDGIEPKSSSEGVNNLTHFWPHKGTEEWLTYTWKKSISVSAAKLYWFDDTGFGECRLPTSWRLEYKVGDKWVPVQSPSYPIGKDKWCEVKFEPITTTSMRLVIQLQKGWSAGVRQWKLVEADE